MNNTDIETFWAVLEHGTMTAAADALFITQPTLSARIQTLEAEVGDKLFLRGKGIKQIQLTEAGRNFVPLARQWQTLLRETQQFSSARKQEYMHVAATLTANRYILPQVYRRFLDRKLPTSLWVESLSSNEAVEAVLHHKCQFAIVDSKWDIDQQLDLTPIFREPFVLVVGEENSTLPDEVNTEMLQPDKEVLISVQPEIMQWHNHWFGGARPVLLTDVPQMVSLLPGDYWTIIPASAAESYRQLYKGRICHLTEPPADRTFYLLTRKGWEPSQTDQMLIEDLKAELSDREGLQLLF